MIEQFYLCRHEDGRIVLSGRVEGIGCTPMSAQAVDGQSAWQVCRERVDMACLEHRPGYGWFRCYGR
jgi:hypothetical protein